MILAMILFGLNLDPLFDAIAAVESENGRTSSNVYQLQESFIKDCNRIVIQSGVRLSAPFRYQDRLSAFKSRAMMETYWFHYGKRYYKLTGKLPTLEVLARIHNGGPDGFGKPATDRYWRRVSAHLNGGANVGR